MKNRTVIYPNASSAISAITIYPTDKLMGIEYTSSCKAYTYVLNDMSLVLDLVKTQAEGGSIGKLIHSSIKTNRISVVC